MITAVTAVSSFAACQPCMMTSPAADCLAASSAPGREKARTSLRMQAPAASAALITDARLVSTETATPRAASASTTGTTRRSSSSSGTASAPGRVDSPPTSTMAAPSDTISSPRRSARPGSANRPPSEKESGVTLRIPITSGRERSKRLSPQCQ